LLTLARVKINHKKTGDNMKKVCKILVLFSALCWTVLAAAAATNTTQAVQNLPKQHSTTHIEKTNEVVNINSADVNGLQKVKYIGKKKAQAIVDFRSTNGNFKSVDDLLKVKCRGINQKWLDKIKAHLAV
jgi:competence protein ComEA